MLLIKNLILIQIDMIQVVYLIIFMKILLLINIPSSVRSVEMIKLLQVVESVS